MFDQIKNIYNLKKQAEELQAQMAQEKFTATVGLVTLTLNGNQELLDVQVADGDSLQTAKDFKLAFAKAQDEMKKLMAEKFRGMI